MSFYPTEVNERSKSPRCAGDIESASSEGASASFLCGSIVKISLQIDADASLIEAARFRTNGCGFMTAAADVVCHSLIGRTLGELHGLPEDELRECVEGDLGKLPAARAQCSGIVFEALRAALSSYRDRRVAEFHGDRALICTCFGVEEETVVEAIIREGITEVGDVGRSTRAGSGCGSCRMLIQELIDAEGRQYPGGEE